jgi:translation initiation factor IF-2
LEQIGGGKVISLKRETENVDEVRQGYECGLKVKTSKKIQLGDILEFYVIE